MFLQIDMDFIAAYESGNGLLNRWEQEVPKLLAFLMDGNVQDKACKSLLETLKNENVEKSKYLYKYVIYLSKV